MTSKKYIIPAGSKIRIEINSSPPSILNLPPAMAKGVIKTRRTADYLPRRKRQSGGFIQFYDLGQIKVGDIWLDLDFGVTPDWDLSFNEPQFSEALALMDYNALDDLITSTPLENFETHFRKIEKTPGVTFNLSAYSNSFSYPFGDVVDDKWTENGLELSDAEIASDGLAFGAGFPLFQDFVLTGDAKNKITSVYDFEASTVSFTPSKTDKIFLVPAINAVYTSAETRNTTTGFDENYYLNFFYRLFPRSLFLDSPFGAASLFWFKFPPNNTLASYENAFTAVSIQKQLSGARAKKFTFTDVGVGDYSDYLAADFPPSDIFPNPPTMPDTSEATRLASNIVLQDAPSGALLAIIKQGANFFYVWK